MGADRNDNWEAAIGVRVESMETMMKRRMVPMMSSLILLAFAGPGTSAANWTATGPLNVPRGELHITALLLDGRVLYAGGDFPGQSAEVYDPITGTFTLTGNMTTPA